MSKLSTAFDRQLATVLNLMTPPHSGYELRSYSVDQIPSLGGSPLTTLSVTRSYSGRDAKFEWHECIFVGPRGGTKTIYKSFY